MSGEAASVIGFVWAVNLIFTYFFGYYRGTTRGLDLLGEFSKDVERMIREELNKR